MTGTGSPAGAVRRHVVVRGRVHGVGFRASVARRAVTLGLAGYVRNCPDGSVEAVFEGEPAAVEAVVAWCGEGPALARVAGVEVRDEPPAGERAFLVR